MKNILCLTAFHNNWPELEKLYEKISSVRRVDAETESDEVYKDFEQCFFDAMEKVSFKNRIDAVR